MSKTVILGAGPAGLGAALELVKKNQSVEILEKDTQVGGISKTINYKNYYFDIGGHRFFTKNNEIEKIWRDLLNNNFLKRGRLSRIYYQKNFFKYPLEPFDALLKIGFSQGFLIGLSYLKSKVFSPFKRNEENFADWVSNRFGKKLFSTFFKSYTEKVWGISTKELSADWAAQRIQDLSLWKAIVSSLFKRKNKNIKTLIEEFDYPLKGPGMMYEKMADEIKNKGGNIVLNNEVKEIIHQDDLVIKANDTEGDYFISSIPLDQLIFSLKPSAPEEILVAAKQLKFRDFISINLIIDQKDVFPDNWIYIQDPEVKLGRVQNFKNWSPAMVPDQNKTSLGLEYFCFSGDDFWNSKDEDLIELAKNELEKIGLVKKEKVLDGFVARIANAYPIYYGNYKEPLKKVFDYLKKFKNLQTVGRQGMFRYNNMDHAICSGILAAKNVLGGSYDVFGINANAEYLESK